MAGEYTFESRSTGGSVIQIDGVSVVNTMEIGSAAVTESNAVWLGRGGHDIAVGFTHSGSGSVTLEVRWSPLPAAALVPLSMESLTVLRSTEKGTGLPEPWLRVLACQRGLLSQGQSQGQLSSLKGCIDPLAVNFSPTALQENGSCRYECDVLVASLGMPQDTDCFAGLIRDTRPDWVEPVRTIAGHSSLIQGQLDAYDTFVEVQRVESVKSCAELGAFYNSRNFRDRAGRNHDPQVCAESGLW